MPTRREQIFQALGSSVELQALLGEPVDVHQRIVAAGGLTNVPERPFITFRMHQAAAHQGKIGRRDYVTIWAHDDPGDYMRIDAMIEAINLAVQAIGHTFEWFEESPDLQDDDMHTITRNTRFTITSSTPERH